MLDEKKSTLRRTWDPVPPVAGADAIMGGDEETWPPLRRGIVVTTPALTSSDDESSFSADVAPAAAPQPPTTVTSSEEAGTRSRHGDRAGVPASSSPMHNHVVSNGAGFYQNGRFVPQPHGRGSRGGYNNRSRRPVFGGANAGGRGNNMNVVHIHVNGNINRGGSLINNRHEHHGQGPHRPSSSGPHQRPHMAAPSCGHPPLSFMTMPPPHMPPYYYGPSYMAPYDPYAAYMPNPTFMPQQALQLQTPRRQMQQQATSSAEEELMKKSIRAQIEYYFSTDNLCKDMYLRVQMDEEGWVALEVIASFPRVAEKSSDLDFILASVLPSNEVEVQNGKIRRRVGWEKYTLATTIAN